MQNTKFRYLCVFLVTILITMCCYLIIVMRQQAFLGKPSDIVNSGFENATDEDGSFSDKLPTGWTFTEGCVIDQTRFFEGNSSLRVPALKTSEIIPEDYSFTTAIHKVYRFGLKFFAEKVEGVKITLYIGTEDDYRHEEVVPTVANAWVDASVVFKFEEPVAAGLKIVVTAGESVCFIDNVYIVEVSPLTTNDGASIRFSAEDPGLRFTGKVDKNFYDYCVENYVNVCAGMMIIPSDYLEGEEDFTFASLANKGVKLLDIRANKWNNSATAERDGFYGFSCAIIDILPQNTDRTFCARSYLRYTYGGEETFIYGNFDIEKNSRSIHEVAKSLMPNIEEYNEIQRKIIIHYATAINTIANNESFVVQEDSSYSFETTVEEGMIKVMTELGVTIKVEQNGEEIFASKESVYQVFAGTVKITVTQFENIEVKHYAAFKGE